jgi:hypothetical protein
VGAYYGTWYDVLGTLSLYVECTAQNMWQELSLCDTVIISYHFHRKHDGQDRLRREVDRTAGVSRECCTSKLADAVGAHGARRMTSEKMRMRVIKYI